jgi:hypothetical protein
MWCKPTPIHSTWSIEGQCECPKISCEDFEILELITKSTNPKFILLSIYWFDRSIWKHTFLPFQVHVIALQICSIGIQIVVVPLALIS